MAEALRFNSDKPMMSYFMRSFPRMAEAIARVKEMGAIKYNDGNWRLGNKPDDEYWNSLFRHLNYIFQGEDYDKDTGCLHLGHAVWNMCALLELNYPDLPARDEEIWAERAAHWAAEKEKREAREEGARKTSGECHYCGSAVYVWPCSGGYVCHECGYRFVPAPASRREMPSERVKVGPPSIEGPDDGGFYVGDSICDDGCQDAVTSPQVAQEAAPGSCPVASAPGEECSEEAAGKPLAPIRFEIPMTPEMKRQCESIRARLNNIAIRSFNPARDV
jgi:hypothetical protein